jgi:hypothetical protein
MAAKDTNMVNSDGVDGKEKIPNRKSNPTDDATWTEPPRA